MCPSVPDSLSWQCWAKDVVIYSKKFRETSVFKILKPAGTARNILLLKSAVCLLGEGVDSGLRDSSGCPS